MKIRLGTFAWTVYRRYTQFWQLGEQVGGGDVGSPPHTDRLLQKECVYYPTLDCTSCCVLHPQLKKLKDAPKCPSKRTFEGRSSDFLERRKVELLEWLRLVGFSVAVCV